MRTAGGFGDMFDAKNGGGFLAGGAAIALWSSGIAFLTSLFYMLWGYAKRYMYTHVTIADIDTPYKWMEMWLASHPGLEKVTTRAELRLSSSMDPNVKQGHRGHHMNNQRDALEPTKVKFLPAVGETHFINHKGHWVWVSRIKKMEGGSYNGVMRSNISITVLGRNQSVVEDMVNDARMMYTDKMKTHTVIWTAKINTHNANWKPLSARPSRPIDTVILPKDTSETLVSDVRTFFASSQWYYSRGIPYRRGYLLYGPPGCGKTSFITALAGELQLVICIINVSSSNLTDDSLMALMSDAPTGSILLLEDVDAAFKSPEQVQQEKEQQQNDFTGRDARKASGGVTFSGLLNAIDGVAGQEGKVLFMTTNHLEKLDDALVRPGRVDVRSYFGHADKDAAIRLFKRFYHDNEMEVQELEEMATKFGEIFPLDEELSMATLQGHLMKYRHDPAGAAVAPIVKPALSSTPSSPLVPPKKLKDQSQDSASQDSAVSDLGDSSDTEVSIKSSTRIKPIRERNDNKQGMRHRPQYKRATVLP